MSLTQGLRPNLPTMHNEQQETGPMSGVVSVTNDCSHGRVSPMGPLACFCRRGVLGESGPAYPTSYGPHNTPQIPGNTMNSQRYWLMWVVARLLVLHLKRNRDGRIPSVASLISTNAIGKEAKT